MGFDNSSMNIYHAMQYINQHYTLRLFPSINLYQTIAEKVILMVKPKILKISLATWGVMRAFIYVRLCNRRWKGFGRIVIPLLYSSDGSCPSISGSMLNRATNPVKKRNSSAFAKVSPRHWRLPMENGMRWLSFLQEPFESRNLSGLKTSPSPQ